MFSPQGLGVVFGLDLRSWDVALHPEQASPCRIRAATQGLAFEKYWKPLTVEFGWPGGSPDDTDFGYHGVRVEGWNRASADNADLAEAHGGWKPTTPPGCLCVV
jgi:hypothetical protein